MIKYLDVVGRVVIMIEKVELCVTSQIPAITGSALGRRRSLDVMWRKLYVQQYHQNEYHISVLFTNLFYHINDSINLVESVVVEEAESGDSSGRS